MAGVFIPQKLANTINKSLIYCFVDWLGLRKWWRKYKWCLLNLKVCCAGHHYLVNSTKELKKYSSVFKYCYPIRQTIERVKFWHSQWGSWRRFQFNEYNGVRVRNCLTMDHVTDNDNKFNGKRAIRKGYNSNFKSCLNWNHRLATDMSWQKLMKAFWKNQLFM